jgi:hypothetical protein
MFSKLFLKFNRELGDMYILSFSFFFSKLHNFVWKFIYLRSFSLYVHHSMAKTIKTAIKDPSTSPPIFIKQHGPHIVHFITSVTNSVVITDYHSKEIWVGITHLYFCLSAKHLKKLFMDFRLPYCKFLNNLLPARYVPITSCLMGILPNFLTNVLHVHGDFQV